MGKKLALAAQAKNPVNKLPTSCGCKICAVLHSNVFRLDKQRADARAARARRADARCARAFGRRLRRRWAQGARRVPRDESEAWPEGCAFGVELNGSADLQKTGRYLSDAARRPQQGRPQEGTPGWPQQATLRKERRKYLRKASGR